MLPWINGVRLKWELESTRQLRHKIVHEGLRLDHSMYGHLQRPMETMTWLFDWFRDPSRGPFSSRARKYPLIAAMRGDVAVLSEFPFAHDYTADGVILRRSAPQARSEGPVVNVVVFDGSSGAMLLKAIESEPADLETLAFTSLSRLGFRVVESAMAPAGSPFFHERCFLVDQGKIAVVFLVDTYELVGRTEIEQVAVRVLR